MVTFVSACENAYLHAAMRKAEEILQPESPFLEEVAKIEKFAMGNITGAHLVKLFQQKLTVKVEIYYPLNIFSRALGYTEDGEDVITLNGYKLQRPLASIVATLVHEVVHVLDFHDEAAAFGHGNNFAKGKGETAPYKLENIALGVVKRSKGGIEEFPKPRKYGSFVFHNHIGYEVPRSDLYQLTKRHLTPKTAFDSCVVM